MRRHIAIWLFICCAMVFATLVVGGVTRLTHSGLSIVEWQPIIGALPPLSQEKWQQVFNKYKQTPEYQQINHQMTLNEFKPLFWWEYFHRMLGRAIGVVFLLPFLYFFLRGQINASLRWKLSGIFVLGGLQGAMGWYMVKSGLVNDPHVSQYRLTAHLGLAFLIFGSMLWLALGMLKKRQDRFSVEAPIASLRRFGSFLTVLIFCMVLSGGLVAGTHAGLAYNTFPLMNGQFIPSEIMLLQPWYTNFFHNLATVQFDHRLIAWCLSILVPLFWFRVRTTAHVSPRTKTSCNLLMLILIAQISLGINTLLTGVPLALAATHQAGAMILFSVILWVNHELRANHAS